MVLIAVTGLTMFLVGGIWKIKEIWDFRLGKQLNFRWDLMGHARRSMEDSASESNLDYDAQLQRFQMGNRLFL